MLVILLIITEVVWVEILGLFARGLGHARKLDQSGLLVIARCGRGCLIVWIVLADQECNCVCQLFSERPLLVRQGSLRQSYIL